MVKSVRRNWVAAETSQSISNEVERDWNECAEYWRTVNYPSMCFCSGRKGLSECAMGGGGRDRMNVRMSFNSLRKEGEDEEEKRRNERRNE